jgi:3-phenylpropionate/trans-cinnamate dioxygenase ferredoxin reductase subunit
MSDSIVIAGAGHAAGQLIASLRQGGYGGNISLVGEEPFLPYQRPPLSKAYLSGELARERLFLRPEKFYADQGVDLYLGQRIDRIETARHSAVLASGERLAYDRLVLATGSRVRQLRLPGSELPGVHYLRNIADVDAIRPAFRKGAKLVIVGAGYIGLEVAAVAAKNGLDVTVIELTDRVMARAVTPEVSDFYAQVHRDAGVELRLGSSPPRRFVGDGRLTAVELESGESRPADLAIVGIGVTPATELAEQAGLECDDGIVVDEFCRTADPDILAIGDCTKHPNVLLGRSLRLESVHNAQEQAKTAAATLCGESRPYRQIPWFWSDQYDLKLQIAGLAKGHEQTVLRGDPRSRSFAVFCLDEGRLSAVEAVNSAREFMWSKKLMAADIPVDTESLRDTDRNFKEIAETLMSGAG